MITLSRCLRQAPRRHVWARFLCTAGEPGEVRVRFAPSPTGNLHFGGLRTALYNYLFARSHGGKFILRIEDTDKVRLVPGAQEEIAKILKWCQIEIDEGPDEPGDYGPYIQSQRADLYKKMADVLLETNHAYRCFCSQRRLELLRKESVERREITKYDNKCRHLTQGEIDEKLSQNEPHTVRFKLEHYKEPWQDLVYGPIVCDVASLEGDPVLLKTNGFPTYHFANVVDDHHMKISHVLRGVEWQTSTTKHVLLYKAFGWDTPQFGHLPLLLNKSGTKLSKRLGNMEVNKYKNEGYQSEAVLSMITDSGSGFKVQSTAGMKMQQLIENFDLSKLSRNPSKLEIEKVAYFNAIIFRRDLDNPEEASLAADRFLRLYEERFKKVDLSSSEFATPSKDFVLHILRQMKNRINKIEDLLLDDNLYLWFQPQKTCIPEKTDPQTVCSVLDGTVEMVGTLESMDEDHLKDKLRQMCLSKKLTYGTSMAMLRLLLSNLKQGPSVAEMITTLGKETTIKRLQQLRARM